MFPHLEPRVAVWPETAMALVRLTRGESLADSRRL